MAEMEYKEPDEIFCPECGRTIKRGATVCPYCETNLKKLFAENGRSESPINRMEAATTPKSKTAAILMAVFLGFWAWLYTYAKNAVKFWIVLGINAVNYIIMISYSCSIINNAVNYNTYNPNYFSTSIIGFTIFMNIVNFGIWIWVVVDNAAKPDSFYEKYPRG